MPVGTGTRGRARGTRPAWTALATGGATWPRPGPSGTRCATVVELERTRFSPTSSFSFPVTSLTSVSWKECWVSLQSRRKPTNTHLSVHGCHRHFAECLTCRRCGVLNYILLRGKPDGSRSCWVRRLSLVSTHRVLVGFGASSEDSALGQLSTRFKTCLRIKRR